MAEPLSLPDPPDEKLERSPLRLVVCQVHHEPVIAVADVSRALVVHQAVQGIFPHIEQIAEEKIKIDVMIGSGGGEAKGADPLRGWRFQSEDKKWTAVISQEYFSVETMAYSRWAEFKDRLASLAHSVARVFSPKLENRLGLRMIDQIENPNSNTPTGPNSNTPIGFKGLIIDEILGPITSNDLSSSVKSTRSLIELEGADGATINLQHGCQLFEETYNYILDHDCFRQDGRPFNVDGILDTVEKFHKLTKQVFRYIITDDLYKYLRGDRQ